MTTVQTEKEYDELDCPGCGDHLKIPRKKASHTIGVVENDNSQVLQKIADLESKLSSKLAEEKPKEVEVPSYLPKHFCNNPDGCEGHPNKRKVKVTKKCSNCDQVAPKKATKCAFCGEKDFEDMDDDDMEKYNIGMEHDHEHE